MGRGGLPESDDAREAGLARLREARGDALETLPGGSVSMDWTPPERYRDPRLLAQGGMGALLLAWDSRTERRVVIKRPRSDPGVDRRALRDRFAREQRLFEAVSHPNVVEILEVGSHDGEPFLVSEFVDGVDLRRRLTESGIPSREEARHILSRVCDAVSHLHEVGILHRDLHPGNVLLGADGEVKVTDFGIAVEADAMGDLTRSGEVLGTIDYSSPEQRHRLPMDERADQFSLGAIAYELLTGHRAAGLFPPPSRARPGVPKALDPVVLRALARDPEHRYPSVRSFRRALDEAFDAGTRHNRRKRLAGLGLAGLLLLTLGACGLLWWRPGEKDDRSSSLAPRESAVPLESVPIAVVESPLSRAIESIRSVPSASRRTAPPPGLDSVRGGLDEVSVVALQAAWAAWLGVPAVIEGSTGMRFVLVPPGRFVMGADDDEIGDALVGMDGEEHAFWLSRFQSERPPHVVSVSRPFYLGAHEVRCRDYEAFVSETGFETWAESSGVGGSDGGTRRHGVPGINWRTSWFPQTPEHPVTQLAIPDCERFCEWISRRESIVCRLPTEAEWEFAARAGSRTPYFFGDSSERASEFAWYEEMGTPPYPVGLKRANPLGALDIVGNVWEYVADAYDPEFYARSDGAVDPVCEEPGEFRIHRGGSVHESRALLRSATRQRSRHHPLARSLIGFRVVVEIPLRVP